MTLKKLDHGFKNDALSYDASPNYQPCVKLSFFFNKKPEVSDEQFHRHWETVHADLTIAAKDFKACKIQRYVQFHQTADMKEKAKQLGLEHVAFDGCSEIWVRDWDDWMAFYSSPEYASAMQPDCAHFMAFPIHVMVGYDNLIFGHAIPGEGGKDGITAETLQSK
ncbi:hypothetical protein LTR48_005138 [Friedmanniomyces endolithicus]|uniref:EthD domain-containing protein n=1 Tax=Rachicladosporium monterosium TaxID=1507873 RepID=A0ABR0L340_9PEZI|nr:hypothetical protein LTR29_009874 [Friedmanniomyces endolithicus]KAK1092031.1 hypothetical protein LTR48_005138 [Friedmanniomyces endolithicus]KAK5142743.1 hypothetical protein LTR32_004977 [Rachicladosporium monterosium]